MTENVAPKDPELGKKARKPGHFARVGQLLAGIVPAALVLLACGGSSDDPAANACEPGRSLACPCPGAADGVQTCKADGSTWNACECGGGSGAGGSAGSGQGGSAGSTQGGSSASGGSGAAGGSGGSGASGGNGGNGGTAGSASGGTSSGGSAGAGNGCPTGRGSEMVRISHPSGDYCIDKTEATKGHYAQFRADKDGDYSGQATYCEWNVDYGQGGCGFYDPVDNLKLPAACMDWCDADAFCKWAGKRLCGKVGGGGNADKYSTADKQEWRNVCEAASPMVPEGSCNAWSPTAVEVDNGDCTGSQPGFQPLTHLLGNVSEWVHECSVGFLGDVEEPNSSCRIYGRSRADQQRDLSCAGSDNPRKDSTTSVGVRCCATAETN